MYILKRILIWLVILTGVGILLTGVLFAAFPIAGCNGSCGCAPTGFVVGSVTPELRIDLLGVKLFSQVIQDRKLCSIVGISPAIYYRVIYIDMFFGGGLLVALGVWKGK